MFKKTIINTLVIGLVFSLFFIGCLLPKKNVESESSDSEPLSNNSVSQLTYAANSILSIIEDKTVNGNQSDYVEWTFEMSQAEDNVNTIWYYYTEVKTKFNITVNGASAGGAKSFSASSDGSGSRSIDLPSGTVTIRMEVRETTGSSFTFTRIDIKSDYA